MSGRDRKSLFRTLQTHSDFEGFEDLVTEFSGDSSELVSKLHYEFPSSVLILGLLHHICSCMESDAVKRDEFFKALCVKLCQVNYLNPSMVALCERFAFPKQFFILSNFLQQVHREILCPSSAGAMCSLQLFQVQPSMPSPNSYSNQYSENFTELDVIGKGGSGVVCKAANKVDNVIYAVKKIPFKFRNDNEFEKVIREARSFANLRHRNIVNYNNAWLDYGPVSDTVGDFFCHECASQLPSGRLSQHTSLSEDMEQIESSSDSSEGDAHEKFQNSSADRKHTTCNTQKLQHPLLFPFLPGNFNSSICSFLPGSKQRKENSGNSASASSSSSSVLVSGSASSSTLSLKAEFPNISQENNVDNHRQSDLLFKESNQNVSCSACLPMKATLYIQMEYCERDLHSWLSEKEKSGCNISADNNGLNTLSIFRQILCGVEYIHSESVIHRDLKPQNIFVSEAKKSVKIGDFGLACLFEQTKDVSCKHATKNSAVRGTLPYSAPEQRRGKKYDFKVDIYSLGIILFELINPCKTQMEFFKTLKAFEEGHLKVKASLDMVELMKKCTRENPSERPAATEILKNPLFEKKSVKKQVKEVCSKMGVVSESLRRLEQNVSVLKEEQNIIRKELLERHKEVLQQNKAKNEEIRMLKEQLELLNLKICFISEHS